MYMLRTEIRKLGGLICFLFVMLAIQAQQYTVTGGNGVPYLLENPGNRIRVYLVYGIDNVEISYTSSSTNHQWYRYKQKALDREPVPCEQNGETSVVRNIEEDAGYYVEDPASGLNGWYVWIIDYSKYAFNVESITVKGNCDSFWLEGSPTVPVMYYYTPTGNRITVKREFNVAYQTLEWSEDNNYFSPKNVQRSLTEGPYSTKINDNETIPLCDTEVTLSGDQFAKHFGIEKSITSDTYQAVAVEVHVDTTFIMDNAENMTAGDGEYISAPATVTFRAYANDPVATLYTWKIYRSDQENGIENPLVEYRDEEIDYTFTEKGDYTAVATVSNATGECEAVSNSIEIKIAESELQIPNAFSPGTTPGINDEFRVAYKSLVTYKCWIFNRWGVQMYHSTNPAEGWDGKKGGKYVAPGVYFYVIDAVGSDGIKYNKKGSINILRPKKIDDEIIEQ